jgi:hypothetical protein
MKNLIAFGLCLAAFNAYSNDTEFIENQETQTLLVDQAATEDTVTPEATTLEYTENEAANDVNTTVATTPKLLTLDQVKELFNAPEFVEFFTVRGFTSEEAFNQIVNVLTDINNKTLVDDNNADIDGLLLTINDQSYFVKACEVTKFTNEVAMHTTLQSNDELNLNN